MLKIHLRKLLSANNDNSCADIEFIKINGFGISNLTETALIIPSFSQERNRFTVIT
jgi:hypothetical protein